MKQDEKLARIGQTIEGFYAQKVVSADLIEAILYSVNAGGKRIRPLLLLELLEGLGLELTEAHFQVAAALEMIHTGSLIHDDLPAMDDDDYRRGRLTSHKKFGEAMAILAGDSLFLYSFKMTFISIFSGSTSTYFVITFPISRRMYPIVSSSKMLFS